MTNDLAEIRTQLQNISERLDDHIMDVLRSAVEDGATKRPPEEKILTRARAAVDKAVGLLDHVDDD